MAFIRKYTNKLKEFVRSIPSKLKEYKRILKISRKPTKDEFLLVAKITALGMLIVGVMGFLIQSIKTLVVGGV